MIVLSFRSRTRKKFVGIIALATLIGWTSLALAVKPDPSAPGNHLLIKEVDVVVDAGTPQTTFTITGQDFSFTNLSDLTVTLGELGALTIGTATDTEIVATYPAAISAGEYLLSVATGNGQSHHDEFDLTLGAVGPQGPQGPTGPEGPQGPAGEGAQSLDTTRAETTFTVPPNNGVNSGVATCPAGYLVMAPGYFHLGAPLIIFDVRMDITSGTTRVGAKNPTTTPWDVTVFASCIRLQ